MTNPGRTTRLLLAALVATALMAGTGCKKLQPNAEQAQTAAPAPRTDQQIASDIQSKISAEQALSGQKIDVAVEDGRATLNGTVGDEASRALAANDAGSVDGVKTVVNNLTVQAAKTAPPPPPAAVIKERKERPAKKPAPGPQVAQDQAPPPPPASEPVHTVAPPPPPPKPVSKTVTLAAGTIVPVRIGETLDSGKTQPNTTFRGSLAADLIADGMVVAPRGSTVVGQVTDVKDATHFTGSSLLSIQLTQLTAHGQRVALATDVYSKQGKGRGKNTAAKAGGGAALGAIIGALAGGGKGAAIGAVTGGGVGAGVNAVTRGEQVQIPAETLVNFRLQAPIAVTTSTEAGAPKSYDSSQDPNLQQR